MSFNKVNVDGSITRVAGGTLYADAPVGAIIPYGGTTAPDGFLFCQGQAVSRTTYAELFKVIGTAFGAGDGSTTFNVPDLREATTKGVGLSGKSNNHFDSDGVALGEFVEDRMQDHCHLSILSSPDNPGSTTAWTPAITPDLTVAQLANAFIVEGRTGATTEVKAVGVNYIIKATQVGVPADLAPVDVVESGNMKPVTSNAVYDTLNASITDLTADETAITYEDYTVETLGAHMYQVGGLCWVHIDIRVTYTGEVALDTDGHKDFWSNKFSIPDFDDVSEWNAVPCFGYVSNSHRRFEITLNNFGVTGGQKAIAFRLRYGEDEPIYTGDVFNLRCVCCFAKA